MNQHKEILKDLESKLQSSDLMAEKYELRCQDLQRITESLKRGMQSIFSKFDFESDGSGGVVESGAPAVEPTVTDANLVHHLGLIEKKANQLLQSYANVKSILTAPAAQSAAMQALHSNLDAMSLTSAQEHQQQQDLSATLVTVLGAGPKVPMGQDLMHINPPKADDYRSDEEDDDDDEDARPLTRDELKSKTLNRLQRRIQGLGGNPGGSAVSGANGAVVNSPGGNVVGGNNAGNNANRSGSKKKVGVKK